jgi:diguanylate cyclase (GGDEF)-like protein
VVKIDQREAYATFNRAIGLGLVGFLAAAVFSIGALAIASQSVLRRIRRVAESASAIAGGDLTARVSDLSTDELGTLSRAFDQMADTLVADMARRHRIEAELAHRARHDGLTGLPNRPAFQHELTAALTERGDDIVAVLFCDLDEFKTVNDDLGHSAGDALLREVTARLRRAVTPEHLLARFGGDEFVAVLRGLHDPAQATEVAERMAVELSAPVALGGRDVFVTTSVGVALSGPDSTAETLIRDADAAMYQAKSLGRSRVVVHDAGIGARASNRLAMTTELHRAIANGSLQVALQPICDLTTDELHAFEALVRWRHEGREIDPSEFVTRATELDLAGALDRWVLVTACQLMSRLRGITTDRIGWLHVNVTGTSLVDDGFADEVLEVLREHFVEPSELCLEIVEDRLGGAPQAALGTLARLRRAGVRVAIDDFGTGHSSLARLRDLPADTVKIDQSFLRNLQNDPTSLAITGAIVSLAQRLGLEVVAEGIESARDATTLAAIGCRFGQGFHIGVPQPADEVIAAFRAGTSPAERDALIAGRLR